MELRHAPFSDGSETPRCSISTTLHMHTDKRVASFSATDVCKLARSVLYENKRMKRACDELGGGATRNTEED